MIIVGEFNTEHEEAEVMLIGNIFNYMDRIKRLSNKIKEKY